MFLINTGMVSGLIDYFQQTGLSPAVGISILAFIMGALDRDDCKVL
jgi:hypothetical protein